MAEITCPFKYNESHIYCKCPHRKAEVDNSKTLSLGAAWIMHLRELKENGEDWEDIALANRDHIANREHNESNKI